MSFLITTTAFPIPLTAGETATFTIRLTVVSTAVSNVQEYIPRLTVAEEEVDIRACRWNKSRGAIGVDCGFTLADIADRSVITADASLKFEVGIVPSGSSTPEWHTVADLQKLSQRSFQVAGDTFSFRSISGVTDKLNSAPATPFLMYDPAKAPYDPTEDEKLYDTEGREYPIEAIPISGLTLYTILEEVIVERCGFAGYDPNGIEDFPVPQFDVAQGESYLDALWALIEPFSHPNADGPLLTETGGVLGLHDTSRIIPEGFPQPPDLTVFGCEDLSIDASFSDVVAAKLQFSVPNDWDFATTRIEVKDQPIGNDADTGAILHRLTIKNIHELRSYYQPEIIVDEREQLFYEYIRTFLGDNKSLNIANNYFDSYARLRTTRERRWFVEPGSLSVDIFGDPSEQTFQHQFYNQYPGKIGKQYHSSTQRVTQGKITVDAENPYRGEPFRQQMRLAHWAGNAHEDTTVETGTLRTHRFSMKPQRNGQVHRQVFDYDNVRDLPIRNQTDSATGEVALSGANSRSRELLVTEDGTEYTGGRIINIAVGSIPLETAIPLVRRKLRQMRMLHQEASLNIIGFNPEIDAGVSFAASDKLEQVEGNFLCVGFSGAGENLGTDQAKWSMTVEGIEI